MKKYQSGFSLIELLFAGALFVVFATGVIEVLISGLNMDRVSEETMLATEYARQGEEAVRFMSAKNFDDIVPILTTGIEDANGLISFSGTDNLYEKYRRTITVEEVMRDAEGNINEESGTIDPDTRKVITTVSWNITPSRPNTVVLQTYLTRFK